MRHLIDGLLLSCPRAHDMLMTMSLWSFGIKNSDPFSHGANVLYFRVTLFRKYVVELLSQKSDAFPLEAVLPSCMCQVGREICVGKTFEISIGIRCSIRAFLPVVAISRRERELWISLRNREPLGAKLYTETVQNKFKYFCFW